MGYLAKGSGNGHPGLTADPDNASEIVTEEVLTPAIESQNYADHKRVGWRPQVLYVYQQTHRYPADNLCVTKTNIRAAVQWLADLALLYTALHYIS